MSFELEMPRTIDAAGATFSYLQQGNGPALVLLHGVGSGARSWVGQLKGLSHAFKVVAWDAPGYGQSSPVAAAQPDASDYAERLRLLLDALGIERLHLVGHSLGAIIATRFARDAGNRLLSLTLAAPSSGHAGLPPQERIRLRDARLDDLREFGPAGMAQRRGPRLVSDGASSAVRDAVVETMSRIIPSGYAQAVRLLSVSDTANDLAQLPAGLPVQFILGGKDVITPSAATLKIAQVRPQAQVHTLDDCGHALYLEQPEAFNRLLVDFMATDTVGSA